MVAWSEAAEAEAEAAAGPLRRLVLLFQRPLGKALKVTEGVKWRWSPPREWMLQFQSTVLGRGLVTHCHGQI